MNVGVFRTMLGFQLQFEGCHHEVMIAADVSARECPHFYLINAGLEALWSQHEVNLIVNLPII